MGLSFLRGFYCGWKRNEWANRFSFRLCQVLLPSPLLGTFVVVEELGEMIRAGGRWGTGTLFLQMLGTQRGVHRLGGLGQPLPTRGAE